MLVSRGMKSGNATATVLTERGQVSVPSRMRKKAGLVPGQRLLWRQTGPDSFSVTVQPDPRRRQRAVDLIGYAKRYANDGLPKRTDDVLKLLREGEG